MSRVVKSVLSCVVVVAVAGCGTVGSALGGGGGGSLDGFLVAAQQASDFSSLSSTQLAQAVLSKDAYDKLTAERDAAMKISDPQEQSAKLHAVDEDTLAQLKNADFEAAFKRTADETDEVKKLATRAGTFNFVLSALRTADVVKQGTAIVSNPPTDPMLVTKVGDVRDSVKDLGNLAENMTAITGKLSKLAKAGGISLPTSAAQEPIAMTL